MNGYASTFSKGIKKGRFLLIQYTTCENGQFLASVTRGKFSEKCLARSISRVPLEPSTINRQSSKCPARELRETKMSVPRVFRDLHEGLTFFFPVSRVVYCMVSSTTFSKKVWFLVSIALWVDKMNQASRCLGSLFRQSIPTQSKSDYDHEITVH